MAAGGEEDDNARLWRGSEVRVIEQAASLRYRVGFFFFDMWLCIIVVFRLFDGGGNFRWFRFFGDVFFFSFPSHGMITLALS